MQEDANQIKFSIVMKLVSSGKKCHNALTLLKWAQGCKAAKDRVTLTKHHCLCTGGLQTKRLGCLFKDLFFNCFISEVEAYLKDINLDFKVLLLVNNAPGYPKDLHHPNVKLIFLPPNTTSLIQPIDQGYHWDIQSIRHQENFPGNIRQIE
jgi:hypothetical protein